MNITNVTIENFGDLMNLVSAETGGIFAAVIIIMLWVVAYIYAQKRYTYIEAAFVSTFLTFMPVILFSYIGLFDASVPILYMLMMASIAVLIYLKGGRQ